MIIFNPKKGHKSCHQWSQTQIHALFYWKRHQSIKHVCVESKFSHRDLTRWPNWEASEHATWRFTLKAPFFSPPFLLCGAYKQQARTESSHGLFFSLKKKNRTDFRSSGGGLLTRTPNSPIRSFPFSRHAGNGGKKSLFNCRKRGNKNFHFLSSGSSHRFQAGHDTKGRDRSRARSTWCSNSHDHWPNMIGLTWHIQGWLTTLSIASSSSPLTVATFMGLSLSLSNLLASLNAAPPRSLMRWRLARLSLLSSLKKLIPRDWKGRGKG